MIATFARNVVWYIDLEDPHQTACARHRHLLTRPGVMKEPTITLRTFKERRWKLCEAGDHS